MDIDKNVADIVKEFGEKFRGRIEDWRLSEAIKYVDFNECSLAFETICDHICEYDVEISSDEFNAIMRIGRIFEVEWHHGLLSCLKRLTRCHDGSSNFS